MPHDDDTEAAPADESMPTTELDPAPPAVDGPLAYSAHTTSMPVIDYQPPRIRPGLIIALVLAAACGVAAAAFIFGRTTAPTPETPARTPDVVLSSPQPEPPAPVAPPVTVTVTPPAPPPTVTVAAPVPPPAITTTSVPPLATPQARIAEPIICSLHNQYPQMQPVDLALSLIDQGIYRDYDEASLVVRLVLGDGCHGI